MLDPRFKSRFFIQSLCLIPPWSSVISWLDCTPWYILAITLTKLGAVVGEGRKIRYENIFISISWVTAFKISTRKVYTYSCKDTNALEEQMTLYWYIHLKKIFKKKGSYCILLMLCIQKEPGVLQKAFIVLFFACLSPHQCFPMESKEWTIHLK